MLCQAALRHLWLRGNARVRLVRRRTPLAPAVADAEADDDAPALSPKSAARRRLGLDKTAPPADDSDDDDATGGGASKASDGPDRADGSWRNGLAHRSDFWFCTPFFAAELLVKVVARYTTLMRQTARGNYGNLLLAKQPELRLFGTTQEIFTNLKLAVLATQPQFENRDFTERLAAEMHAFRGRELPGFTNSQVFYGFMVQNIEEWRPYVEECRLAGRPALLDGGDRALGRVRLHVGPRGRQGRAHDLDIDIIW